MSGQELYQVSRPSLWYRLGWRYKYDEALFEWRNTTPSPTDWWKPGCLSTLTVMRIGWLDRIRLLISGTCELRLDTRTNVIVDRAESRSQFSVLPPSYWKR
jgi:hypothetical protein